MELRESLEKLELKLIDLVIQPYFKLYLSTLPNMADIKENITIVLDETRSILRENDLYIMNHYHVLIENYYSLLNFYDEQLESSTLFASKEILKMMGLNPDFEKSYHIFFKVDMTENFPLEMQVGDSGAMWDELFNMRVKNAEITDDEAFSFLLKVINQLKKIKEKNKDRGLNLEIENLFMTMNAFFEDIRKNDNEFSSDKFKELLNTINNIENLLVSLGWVKQRELDNGKSIPSKVIGSKEMKVKKNKKESK